VRPVLGMYDDGMPSFPGPRNRSISVLALESASGIPPRERYFAPWREISICALACAVMCGH
jgi:hypothetical protein